MEEKKIKGRKRHILVDSCGFLLEIVVHSADIHDNKGALLVLDKLNSPHKIQKIFADMGYRGDFILWAKKEHNIDIEIVKRPTKKKLEKIEIEKNQLFLFDKPNENKEVKLDKTNNFEILPFRWVVERTLAWLCKSRRLSKDYEKYGTTTENLAYLVMIRLMLNRLCKDKSG